MERDAEPTIYEWQVLPFGTTCSPCCAIYALQRHAQEHPDSDPEVWDSVENAFYVDNCLQSVPSMAEVKALLDKVRNLLSKGGFEVRQWAKPTLGLRWSCIPDTLGYKHRSALSTETPTLRTIYRTLASQYNPLGYILPYTTQAKVLVQDLWQTKRDWDEPIHPADLVERWICWETELSELSEVQMPRCYVPPCADQLGSCLELHVFCDASKRAYGVVSYLREEDKAGHIHVSFVMARSRVAPKKQLSRPRLELSAALSGAQLASTLRAELTLPIQRVIYWSDSTTVLTWLKSESCRYKVFVGTRIAEIQDLTEVQDWRYVDSPTAPRRAAPPQPTEAHELRKSAQCYSISTEPTTALPDLTQSQTLPDLITATNHTSDGVASIPTSIAAETLLLQHAQAVSFPEELKALKAGREVAKDSRLLSLAPEYDQILGVIRVGGRLRQAEVLDPDAIHPIILDSRHPSTRLLIKSYDERLLHPGPERVYGEMRRKYWILGGRGAIRKHQYACVECQRWRARATVPKMADLPPARLRLLKPPFWSTGVDCFGPLTIKLGRRVEKRWGILFKCLTTRCVHLDLLESLDTEAFLMALRQFISDGGNPTRSWLTEAQTSRQKKPGAPHFGGTWEREIKSVKTALRVVLGDQTVTETVLWTVLIEVEGILNSKPLGYLSADIADPNPITPNMLLMGR
eukprot:XP_014048430.1 PREDICTED: uncharacterized protein LOC106601054 [Salmo salar]